MFNEKFRWDKNYDLTIKKISEDALINVLPTGTGSDVMVFEKNSAKAFIIDGGSLTVKEEQKICEHSLAAVENVKLRGFDHFLASDDQGNIFTGNYTLDCEPRPILKRENPIHSILDIGRSRVLVAYNSSQGGTKIEMITPNSGNSVDAVHLEATARVRHMYCHSSQYKKGTVKVLIATDRSIVALMVKNFSLEVGSIWHLEPGVYLDEVYMNDRLESRYVHKFIPIDLNEEPQPSSVGIWSYDEDEKLSSVSLMFDTKIVSERGKVLVCANDSKYHRVINIDGNVIHRHIHHPDKRIVGVTLDGKLVVIDFRMNVARFLMD